MIFSQSPRIGEEWKTAVSMFWSFGCDVVSAYPCNASKNQSSQHTVYLQLTRENSETPWRLENKLELEGLLGLWVWSLKSDPAVERSDQQSRLTVSRATEIPSRRIVSYNRNIAESDLKIWLGGEIPSLAEGTLHLSPIQRGDPSTNKWKLDKEVEVRFFGWHATDLSQSQDFSPFKNFSASANSSLLSLCTQEVFGFFIASILSIVDDIGDISIQEPLHFRLENELVSEIVKLFTETQLGSKEDALLCVLPPMIPRLRLSSIESALGAAIRKANQHRRGGEWMHAETVLRWAWKICNESQVYPRRDDCQNESTLADESIQQAVIALGELYRWAMCGDDYTKKFGRSGFGWLSTQKSSSKEPGPLAVDGIIDRYLGIAEQVSRRNDISGSELLSVGKDLNATLLFITLSTSMTNEDKGKALCSAAKHGWTEVVLALLELGAEPDFKDPERDSRTALSQAAESGNFNTMKELIDWGAFPNSADAKHRTPLSYASGMGHRRAAKILLADQRVGPDSKDIQERTPLYWAAIGEHEAVAKLLIEGGADLEVKDEFGGMPLSYAAIRGHEGVVKLLIERGANLEAKGKDGQTPLAYAVNEGHEAAVKLLIERGANLEVKDKDERTLLVCAAERGYKSIMKLLERHA